VTCFPVRYGYANVLVEAALYPLGMSAYSFLPAVEKSALQQRLERPVHVLGADISLWRLRHQLFFDRLSRSDGGVTRDYSQRITVERVGASGWAES
jgi:hypothetical protein